MATDNSTVVSGSLYVGSFGLFPSPASLASASMGPITGSMLGASAPPSIVVSGSFYTGSFGGKLYNLSQGASGSLGPITGSMLAANVLTTVLVNFQTSTGSSGGGGTFTAVTYVMSGYYIAGATRETWSGPSINTPNPTGHPLVDVTVMGSYPPQNTAT